MAGASMSPHKAIAADLRLAAECLRDAAILMERNSRNAPYLMSQAAEHMVRAVSTSEGLHIERSKAHLIDTNIRAFPDANLDKTDFLGISHLESYATTYRYPTAGGRIPSPPAPDELRLKLDGSQSLLKVLLQHYGVDLASDKPASNAEPRRQTLIPSQR